MAVPGISSLGIKFGYAVETTEGTKPAAFKQLTRVNAISGISLETEQIDASALEDLVTAYIAGRQDTGGSWPITVNLTDDTIAEWEELIELSDTATKAGLSTWFVIWSPYLSKSFYVKAQAPQSIPLPEFAQNELQTVEMSLTINEYIGLDTAIEPTASGN